MWRGVCPFLFWAPTSAFCARRYSTSPLWPFCAAMCKHWFPFFGSTVFTAALMEAPTSFTTCSMSSRGLFHRTAEWIFATLSSAKASPPPSGFASSDFASSGFASSAGFASSGFASSGFASSVFASVGTLGEKRIAFTALPAPLCGLRSDTAAVPWRHAKAPWIRAFKALAETPAVQAASAWSPPKSATAASTCFRNASTSALPSSTAFSLTSSTAFSLPSSTAFSLTSSGAFSRAASCSSSESSSAAFLSSSAAFSLSSSPDIAWRLPAVL
mmetsp:Transcript_65096/g.146182  ORF Transcript_65096/g.146182 Transcript_65096/m.146182 type:complete len:272 (+) Transcript_65096:434-1249(+)